MTRQWIKNAVIFMIAVVLLSGLPGCSVILSPFAKKEPVTLKFVYLENAADYQALANAFHKQHNNIQVELDPVQYSGNVMDAVKLKSAEADAVRLPMTWISGDMADGFMSLDSLFTTDKTFPSDDLFPGSLEALTMNGHQVALPAGIDPFVMFYIPQKFTDAGVQVPAPSWQLEDFLSAARAVNSTDESLRGTPRFTYGFCTHPNMPDALMFVYLFGGSIVNNPNLLTTPTLNARANIEALSWYSSLKNEYGLIPDLSNERQMGMLVGNGACGFWMDWLDRSMYGDRGASEVAMLPLPTYKSQFTIATLDGYMVRSGTQHPDESWQWIRFLMENQSASGSLIPPLQSQVKSPEYAARVSQGVRVIARSMPQETMLLGLEMYRQDRFQKVVELFYRATSQVMNGTAAPKAALDQAQMEAEQVFK